jgi:DNA helicase-2/ATP-dependent DNA helicase PcrA
MKAREFSFEAEYNKLNKAQKDAVDTIDGPVMVVAGPGTGKTQILALRIANILKKTDIKGNGILCLTFTNSGVEAMRERLVRYIGETGKDVNIFTFHSFGIKVIEEHFKVLGLPMPPKLLDETEGVMFFDEILQKEEWEYLRPRADAARYYKDLRSIISLLKRERISREDFEAAIEKEIKFLKEDEKNISSRGESKGKLKKEVQKQIEGLEKSKEISKFLELYDAAKVKKNMIDYDDVLESLVKIVEISEEARADVRERYLYLLVDEHQDSSRVQNEFIAKVWGDVERPDVFVVGDDRQLIYGFSGASIDHFVGFKKTFPEAKLIPLLQNYRSTQVILDASHALLKSVMSDKELISDSNENNPIKLVEAENPEQEILAAAFDIKEKIKAGVNPDECAILVPKNRQVRSALEILHREGLAVSLFESLNLFDQKETGAFLRVLNIIDSGDAPALALSFFDEYSLVDPIEAHKFFSGEKMRDFSADSIFGRTPTLFKESSVEAWAAKLSTWKRYSEDQDLKSLIQKIAEELFNESVTEGKLVSGKEIAATLLSLLEKRPEMRLHDFVLYLGQLEAYGETIPLVSERKDGVKVLTMHSSKGLEFDYVWIAHMDERSLSGGKKLSFTLPESIAEKIEERDIDAIKRKLYVAITRAKRFCTMSYSSSSLRGSGQELAQIIAELPEEVFEKEKAKVKEKISAKTPDLSKLTSLVAEKYEERYVSATLINNFFECPWKWYFRNLLQLPEPQSASLEFGNAVHAAIDQILKLNKAILPEDREVAKVVARWIENRFPNISPQRENEQSVSVKDDRFPHFSMYGKIDLIENLGANSLRVTDFKTGGVRKKSDIEKLDEEGRMSGYLRQLAMYSYLIKQSKKWKASVTESRLEFVEAKSPAETFYDTVIGDDAINLIIKDIKDYDELIKTGEWISRACNYNSYGKNTECEYCKIAEIYKS